MLLHLQQLRASSSALKSLYDYHTNFIQFQAFNFFFTPYKLIFTNVRRNQFSYVFNSQNQIVNSPLKLLHNFRSISYENLVLDQDNNMYLISSSNLTTCLLEKAWILQREGTYQSLLGEKELSHKVLTRRICQTIKSFFHR